MSSPLSPNLPPPFPPPAPHARNAVDLASPAPYPMRSSEEHASVRRRVGPLAVAAFICAAAGNILLLLHGVDQTHPPLVMAVNLSFCAMMMGIGIIFYARQTPGTRIATTLSVLALLLGFVGPLIYASQTVRYRKAAEEHELGNVQLIANAAEKYAAVHAGVFPESLLPLLQEKLLDPAALRSPYTATPILDLADLASAKEPLKVIADHSDYQYFGQGLKLAATATTHSSFTPATAPALSASDSVGGLDDIGNATGSPITSPDPYAHILIASAREPIMRIHLAIALAAGDPRFITLEEAETILANSNNARHSLGFTETRPPESVQKAQELENRK